MLVALGALIGLWVFRRELHRSGLPESAVDSAVAGILGGMAGAKLLWVFEHLGEEPALDLILSRGGMSWFGGLTGGVLAGLAVMQWKRLPKAAVLAAATPALAIGHMIGRIGCFLVGDDYGRPTDLPWGVAFPQGLPRPRRACIRHNSTRRWCSSRLPWSCSACAGNKRLIGSCSAPTSCWPARFALRSSSSGSTNE